MKDETKAGAQVIWRPQAKQTAFMERPEYEVLYGGAAGGGKSDALLIEALRQVDVAGYRALIVRKTFPQLEGLIARAYDLYPRIYPDARYIKTERAWHFPSGAVIFFGHMQFEQDKFQYQGKAYDFIGFDELTHFTKSQYMYLMSRNRPVGAGTRVYIRATANPGGVGHAWVKERFITCAPPMTPVEDVYSVTAPDGRVIEMRKRRVFIPATVFDNDALLQNDPAYLATLSMLPQAERDALLYGDWDSFEGQVFREWKNDPDHYRDRQWTHVVAPFMPPRHWQCWRGFDFGYARPFSVGWYVADEDGKIYRVRELYGCTQTPNEGVRWQPGEIARRIVEIEKADPYLQGRDIFGVADPSIFDESRGQSIAAIMAAHPNYIYWRPGDNARIAGWQQYHHRFAFDARGECMFQVFDTCKAFIRTVPALVYDERRVEDVDTSMEDHIADECRYVLMENPISPRLPDDAAPPRLDPLNRTVKVFNR